MGYNWNNQTALELWAIINTEGEILYSRGGSSTKPHLLVFPTEKKAQMASRNHWIKSMLGKHFKIACIYRRGQAFREQTT